MPSASKLRKDADVRFYGCQTDIATGIAETFSKKIGNKGKVVASSELVWAPRYNDPKGFSPHLWDFYWGTSNIDEVQAGSKAPFWSMYQNGKVIESGDL